MLERINKIKNVGIFKNYSLNTSLNGDVKFSNTNIIYGKNGSGKSTLAWLLRSLSNGDNDIVKGRKSIDETSNQVATLTLDNNTYTFGEKWSNVYPKLEIYDQQFINENIFIGNEISSDNRRNQFEVIVGKDNIDINAELVNINDILRELNRETKNIELDLTKKLHGDITLNEFLNLKEGIEIETIDKKLAELTKLKNSYNQISEILNINNLDSLGIPAFDIESFVNLIQSDTRTINTEVELKMKSHMEERDLELKWIQTGFNRVHDRKCPLCNQLVDKSDIFIVYRLIFDESINNYNDQLKYYNNIIEKSFSETNSLKDRLLIEKNINAFEEINKYVGTIDLKPELGDMLGKSLSSLYNQINTVYKAKIKDPFNLEYNFDLLKLKDDYLELIILLEKYNNLIDKINSLFKDYKMHLNEFNSNTVEKDICIYLNMKMLKDKDTINKVERLKELTKLINSLNNNKNAIKEKLYNINDSKIRDFNKTLNRILKELGTSFEIKYIVPKFYVKGTEAEYKLIIRNKEVKTKVGNKNIIKTINFNNTLSQGEKSILAFAYFLTSLTFNRYLGETIVVFDDPTNFSDIAYKQRIANEIIKLSPIIKQTIILTHDMEFSKIIWDLSKGNDVTGLYLDYFDDSAQIVTRDAYRIRNAKNRI